jgi:hypothetical protein
MVDKGMEKKRENEALIWKMIDIAEGKKLSVPNHKIEKIPT